MPDRRHFLGRKIIDVFSERSHAPTHGPSYMKIIAHCTLCEKHMSYLDIFQTFLYIFFILQRSLVDRFSEVKDLVVGNNQEMYEV
jgi:hypothetical protein